MIMADNSFDTKKQTLQEKIESEFLRSQQPATPQPQTPSKGPLKSLRTFQGDMEEILKNNNGSIASVAIAEQKRREEEKKKAQAVVPPPAKKESLIAEVKSVPTVAQEADKKEAVAKMSAGFDFSTLPQQKPTDSFVYDTTPEREITDEMKRKIYLSLGTLLLILGVITIGSIIYIKSTDTVETVAEVKTLIPYSKAKSLMIASSTRKDFITSVLNEKRDFSSTINTALYLNTGSISDVTTILTPQIPSILARSLSNTYMMGIYAYDTNEPFIILTGTDFGLSYAGMLQWEKTILLDIGELFGINPATAKNYTFEDEVVKNKDLRVIKNPDRKTIFLYTFLDRNTILITTNESVMSAILAKFNSNKASF
jgi:hypothetical protein